MTNGNSLFGVDPTEGFIQYVNTVKPYHTKLLDVLVEYVYTEKISTLVTERWSWRYMVKRPDTDTEYACGYGYRWDASSIDTPGNLLSFNIKSAVTNQAGPNSNSFLIEFTPQQQFSIVVTDTRSNELAFASRFAITSVNPAAKSFSVAGDITGEDFFSYDEHVYITENSANSVNGKYTFLSAAFDGSHTTITVAEPVSLIASVTGFVNVVVPFSDIPYWPSGTAVKVTSSGVVPVPLNSNETYYFIPSTRVGFFTLANRRYPQEFEQFIDLMSLGTGVLDIERTEPFVPGDPIYVFNTGKAFNDGYYIIADIVKEGSDFRARVLQTVPKNSPFGSTYDGAVTLDKRSYDFPSYCPLTRSSDMHAYTFIHEDLKFTFELSFKNDIGTTMVENQTTTATASRPLTGFNPSENIIFGFGTPQFDTGVFDPAPHTT